MARPTLRCRTGISRMGRFNRITVGCHPFHRTRRTPHTRCRPHGGRSTRIPPRARQGDCRWFWLGGAMRCSVGAGIPEGPPAGGPMPAASTAIASSSVGVHSFSSRSIKYLVR
eukprot:scaffold9777_cov163-Isochrysis_galbana.AAC.3